MSSGRRLPEASVLSLSGPISDWPAPSATAMSAWSRDSSPFVQPPQQAALPLELERHFGNQREVDVAARQRRERHHEPGIAPHDLHQPDPVRVAAGLGVRAVEHPGRLLHRGVETERLVDVVDVVSIVLGTPKMLMPSRSSVSTATIGSSLPREVPRMVPGIRWIRSTTSGVSAIALWPYALQDTAAGGMRSSPPSGDATLRNRAAACAWRRPVSRGCPPPESA